MIDCNCVPGHRCDCWDYRPSPDTDRIDALRIAIDEAVESLNAVWTEPVVLAAPTVLRLVETITALQKARTVDDIANGRDWFRPSSDTDAGLDEERFDEAWRRAERATMVRGFPLTPHDVRAEYARLATSEKGQPE